MTTNQILNDKNFTNHGVLLLQTIQNHGVVVTSKIVHEEIIYFLEFQAKFTMKQVKSREMYLLVSQK